MEFKIKSCVKSIHTTYKDLKGVAKSDLEQMINEPDSVLHVLAG